MEVNEKDIDAIVKELETVVKFGWYTHFTDYKSLLIVFRGNHFVIRVQKVIKEHEFGAVEFKADPKDLPIWKKAFDYGTNEGKVDPRYIIKVF